MKLFKSTIKTRNWGEFSGVIERTGVLLCRAGRASRRTDDTRLTEDMMLILNFCNLQEEPCNYFDKIIVTNGFYGRYDYCAKN